MKRERTLKDLKESARFWKTTLRNELHNFNITQRSVDFTSDIPKGTSYIMEMELKAALDSITFYRKITKEIEKRLKSKV